MFSNNDNTEIKGDGNVVDNGSRPLTVKESAFVFAVFVGCILAWVFIFWGLHALL